MKNSKLALLILMVTFAFTLSACNTVEGVGKDIKKVGGEIEEAADKK